MNNAEPPVVIKVDNVYKDFRLPHEKLSSVKSAFVKPFRRKNYEAHHALRGVSFEVKKGEFLGIIGRNGCGKSTLLKMIAGIYQPTKGSITVNGKISPFLELGVGFNPELTGRENVFLNGALLGFSKKEMLAMYEEIVNFAELHDFMDQKLINYSSGMQVRLAFSVAIQARADILLLDEVLAVGDEAFQRKCEGYFTKAKKDGKTIILVTHSMESVRKYCDKAVLIQDGAVKILGNPDKIADEYYRINLIRDTKNKKYDKTEPLLTAKITSERLLHPNDTLEMEIKYRALNDKPILAKTYIELNGQAIMATNPRLLGWENMITRDTKEHVATYSLPLKDFNKGEYKVIALLEDVDAGVNIVSFGYDGETIIKIENLDKSSSGGILANQAKMDLEK